MGSNQVAQRVIEGLDEAFIGQSRSNVRLDNLTGDEMLPIYYSMDGEKDERFKGVILLEGGDIEKKTAEDCGAYWHIRDWEVLESGGIDHWFCRSGYTLDKELIAKLAKVPNVKLTGSPASGESGLNAGLSAGRIELRFAWLIDQIEARFPGSINQFSSRPPELSALEAIDKMIQDKADNV